VTRARPEQGWASLSADELRDELESRGLSATGAEDDLVARLEEADAAGEAAPSEEAPTAAEPEAGPGPSEEAPPAAEPDEPDAGAAEEAPTAAEPDEPDAGPSEEEEAPRGVARRRGSAETSTSTGSRRAPRREDGAIVVRARAKYVRSAPRKARLVMDHIRGRQVEQARAILDYTPRAVSADILKLLNSAVANAESNHELGADELRIGRAFVDEGPTIKRYRPRALGRATRINKRTSHMTIELTTEA
jgi:ribosomal protein L22